MKTRRANGDADTGVNPSTRRSRELRERRRRNKRDPLVLIPVWLPDSQITQLGSGMQASRPADRSATIDEKQWQRALGHAVRLIVEEALSKQPRRK